MNPRRILAVSLTISVCIIGSALLFYLSNKPEAAGDSNVQQNIVAFPSPTPFDPYPYQIPTIPVKRSYLTLLVGDSMIQSLGINVPDLRTELIKRYPTHEFVNYNFGIPSQSIGILPNLLNIPTSFPSGNYPSILSQGFDLIVIESFAYNPFSELTLDEGLQKREKILDDAVKALIQKHPESVIVFMTPIAPNKYTYATGTFDLSQEVRGQWVAERAAYIENHRQFARQHNIPLIDVYEKSLNEEGTGDLVYINPNDNIHPSVKGSELMIHSIADFIYQNKIFPE